MSVRETVTVPRVSPFSYCMSSGWESQIMALEKALHYRHTGSPPIMKKPAVIGMTRCPGACCSAVLTLQEQKPGNDAGRA